MRIYTNISTQITILVVIFVGIVGYIMIEKEIDDKRMVGMCKESAIVIKDIRYADKKSLTLDLYIPDEPSALLVWIHGGGWTNGDKKDANQIFKKFIKSGYAVAYINYSLTNIDSHPRQIQEIKGAIRWLRANADNYGYNTSSIIVGGGSSGAHLALLLGLSGDVAELEGTVGGNLEYSSKVDAIVDFYGISDLSLFDIESPSFNRLGNISSRLLESASPVYYLTSDDPPVIIFHGDKDVTVSISQSSHLNYLYNKMGLRSYFYPIEGATHGGDEFGSEKIINLIKEFLLEEIKNA
ncbi:MAG: lipase/esterase [Candidatus Campbellbacteria bacterium GW2011_OD1_34_28]|nr:MAG: lipase/esterase [Candidatus Campbellbacteria bacterium GW2011_OD1_34_28]